MRKLFTNFKLLVVFCFLFLGTLAVHSQEVTDPSSDLNYDADKAAQVGGGFEPVNNEGQQRSADEFESFMENNSTRSSTCFIPVDGSYTAIPRNDDGSYGPISLPFTFSLYGSNYNQIWINTNGNITFTGPVSQFSAAGFPFSTPMVAPFWGDVDTRCGGGAIYFKVNPTNVIVTWNGVGYYSCTYNRLNTFQAIIGTYADPLTGLGQNVALNYADMQWTTGNASSGSGGFGGTPATVGVNEGPGSNYIQIGRFNQNNSYYDGPGGAADGINYLDDQCVSFNVSSAGNIPPSFTGLPSNNTIDLSCGEVAHYSITAIAPEVNQNVSISVNTGGLCNTTATVSGSSVSLSVIADNCNEGSHVISLTATDNGNPSESSTVDLIVNVTNCCVPPNVVCPANVSVVNDEGQCGAIVIYADAAVSGSSPTVSYSHPSGSFFPIGETEVFVTAANSCGTDACSFIIKVVDAQMPTVLVQDVVAYLEVNGQASVNLSQIDIGSSDNCGIASMVLSQSDFNCAHLGSNAVELLVTDVHGNSATATFNVEVIDNTSPVVTYTSGTNYSSQDGIVDCTYTGWSINGGGFYTVESDNCSQQFTVVEEEYFNGNLISTATWSIGLGGSHPWRAWSMGVTTMVITVYDGSGNSSSGTYTQTVIDDEIPVVLTQDIDVYLDASGFASITESMVDAGTYDNCELASLAIDVSNFSCENIGVNVVELVATDIYGLVNSASANVNIIDEVPPVAICKNVSVTLVDGEAFVTPEMIDDGSNDACGVASLELDVMSFDCSNIGPNLVELTVTDNNGNASTCSATVEVVGEIPSCSIDVELANDTYTGGDGFTLFLGYGPQSLTVSSLAQGGGPITYEWSGGNGFLSSTSSANPVFSPTEDGVYTLTCLVTNSFGCETMCDVEICVMDIRAGGNGNNQKVYICHVPKGNPNNAKTLKVSVNAVPAHLSSHGGDALGYCGQECGTFKMDIESVELEEDQAPELSVYPNPTLNTFNVMLDSHSSEDVAIEVFDHLGKKVISLEKLNANSIIELGEQLSPGFYYINVVQGDYTENIKVVKSN